MNPPPAPIAQSEGGWDLKKKVAFGSGEPVLLLFYLTGFLAPWQRNGSHATLWLAASSWAARLGWLALATATTIVTVLSLACLVLGTVLRICSTAYLDPAVMPRIVASGHGPMQDGLNRSLRRRRYLGSWLLALGTSILMPLSGAVLFLVLFSLFSSFLISAEERRLSPSAGDAARRLHPFELLLPGFGEVKELKLLGHPPRWRKALLMEIYPIAFTACFALFAWRYNAVILIKCLLICYGISLIARALFYPWR